MSDLGPIELLELALADLGQRVALTELEPAPSHTPITATGLDDPDVAVSIGRYAVGALAGAVDINASLQDFALVGGVEKRPELLAEVHKLVGETNTFASPDELRFRDTWRNAWIAEIATHAFLVVRARQETACLHGPVRAITQPHTRPTRQGLDSVAIYEHDERPVIVIGETKASQDDGSGQLTIACDIYDQIDAGMAGSDLRQHILSLRLALAPELREHVSEALWRESRCYLPVILHEAEFNAATRRERLAALHPPVARRRVLILRFGDFHQFFDGVADAMRAAVDELVI